MSKHLFSSSILSRSLVPASPSSSCMSSRVIQRLTASQLRCNSSSGLSERNIDIALDEIQYSKPLDEKDRRRIKTLLTLEKPWQITKDNRGLEKAFRFSTFKSAMSFVQDIADYADKKDINHHPTWTNTYNRVHIKWSTHKPLGLSIKDVDAAELTEEAAARH